MLVNLTPHALVLETPNGDVTVPPSGDVARVAVTPGALGEMSGVPCPVRDADQAGEVINLPGPQEGVTFIVSGMVGASCKGRTDVLVPGTGPKDNPRRNEKGHVVAVTCLKRV